MTIIHEESINAAASSANLAPSNLGGSNLKSSDITTPRVQHVVSKSALPSRLGFGEMASEPVLQTKDELQETSYF